MQDQNQNLSQVVNPTPQAVSFGGMNTALSQVGAVPGRPVVGAASGVGLSGVANGGGAWRQRIRCQMYSRRLRM